MNNKFIKISPKEIKDNTFKLIGSDWMLITAGNLENFNMMTASWGGFGVLWKKNVVFCFIRKPRYTYEFMEKYDNFSLTFFDEKYRDILNLCGTKSGRDINKVDATKLIPLETDNASVYFEQARLVIECKKMYFGDIDPCNFLDAEIEKCYPASDYHRMYIGEILNCFVSE